MVATQLLLFLSCGACRGPDSLHKFISSRGPDKILSPPRFGPRARLWTCLPYRDTSLMINWWKVVNRSTFLFSICIDNSVLRQLTLEIKSVLYKDQKDQGSQAICRSSYYSKDYNSSTFHHQLKIDVF